MTVSTVKRTTNNLDAKILEGLAKELQVDVTALEDRLEMVKFTPAVCCAGDHCTVTSGKPK